MFKSISKSCILSGNINNLIIKSFRYNSSKFENIPNFTSDFSLNRLYPKSETFSQRVIQDTTPDTQRFNGHIPMKQLDISYARSSGPGGQHVNTNNTKVTVKLHLSTADWIPEETKQRLQELHKNNINKEGFWIVRSDKTRAQIMNVADCVDKIRCYITEASKPIPKPSIESLEKIRENREKAAIRRLENKKNRSLVKSERRSID